MNKTDKAIENEIKKNIEKANARDNARQAKAQRDQVARREANERNTTNGQATHSYDIETVIDSQIAYIYVEANNRSQAAAIAKKQGYVVRSVNMTG